MPNPSIREAIRNMVEPWLTDQGFEGQYPEFHRICDDQIHLIEVIKDKYGGYFWFDIGATSFSAARYRRLQKTDPEAARLPRLYEIELSQREQIYPRLDREKLRPTGDKGLPLFGEEPRGDGKGYDHKKLEQAASSCLPRIKAWFRDRSDGSP